MREALRFEPAGQAGALEAKPRHNGVNGDKSGRELELNVIAEDALVHLQLATVSATRIASQGDKTSQSQQQQQQQPRATVPRRCQSHQLWVSLDLLSQ